jgi:hypothetical protein
MDREHWRRPIGLLKRVPQIARTQMERRLNIEELLLLAEAVFDSGLEIRASEKWSAIPPPCIIVEIPELALRLRKTPQAIKDALLLLRAEGLAEPLDCHGHWKLRLEGDLSDGISALSKKPDNVRLPEFKGRKFR